MGDPLTVGSLFAGIGGFDLAAERVGWEVKWQVEIDDYCTKVLEKHWPHVRRYRDVRAIDWSEVEPVDLVCGGFPCQPHSLAGRRLAAADNRDLWPEVVRCLRGVKPGLFVGENVSGLLSSDAGRFFGTVLRDLAALGFDAEWDCVPASAVGAPHRRDRIWIVAYPANSLRREKQRSLGGCQDASEGEACARRVREGQWGSGNDGSPASRSGAADADSARLQVAGSQPHGAHGIFRGRVPAADSWWAVEPNVGRVAYGIPNRVDRLRGLGNAIVPQVAEWIFRQIQAAEESVTR